MKKTYTVGSIFAFTLLLLAICGCKKERSDSTYYVRFKANGTAIKYDNPGGLSYNESSSGSLHLAIVSGFNNSSSNISLQVYDSIPITQKSYSGYSISGGITLGAIIGHLDTASGQLFSSGGVSPVVTITINELNPDYARGTFTGTLTKSGYSNINVTDGEFYVKR